MRGRRDTGGGGGLMPSLIANCLARLVAEGRISQKAASQAQQIHDGMQGDLLKEMGQSSADAVAALEAARVMGEQARLRKVSIAKDAIALTNARERMLAHPKGKVAGLGSMLARDIYEKGGENLDKGSQAIFGRLNKMFGPSNELLSSKLAGLRQDIALAKSAVREIFGDKTGNSSAEQIAKGWKNATDYAANRAKAAGKLFQINDDWRVFQFWTSKRVHDVGVDEFLHDINSAMASGGLRVLDKETSTVATPMKLPEILKGAYHDITTGGGQGTSSGAFSPQMRVFRFADGKAGADAWLNLMGKYGPGQDIYSSMRQHLQGMSREIALLEQFGPNYRSNFKVLHNEAVAAARDEGAKVIRLASSPRMLAKMFDTFTGKSYGVSSELMHGLMAGVRGWLTAVQLPGAVIASTFGDSATTALASQHMGIPAVRVFANAAKTFAADSPERRAFAARLLIDSSATGASAIDHARYAGEWLTHGTPGKVADTMLRVTGLQAETDALQRAFTMEGLGHIADQVGKAFKNTDAGFQTFLTRYGITPKEWDVIRKAPVIDYEGARYFDPSGVADDRLGEKMMAAVLSERDFSVVTPDLRVRALMTPTAPKGSVAGVLWQSAGMYRSFTVSMAMTHMLRTAMQSDYTTKIGYGLKLALFTTVAGAMTILAKDMVYGKDPRQMNSWRFWAQASLAGGGLGVFGDFFSNAFSNTTGGGIAAAIGGPMVSVADDLRRTFSPAFSELAAGNFAGAEDKFGAALAREMRRNLIPTPFYARLAGDRLLWDQVQAAVDPQYRKSWKRQEEMLKQGYGSQFWWRPGSTTPDRPPNIGNAIQ